MRRTSVLNRTSGVWVVCASPCCATTLNEKISKSAKTRWVFIDSPEVCPPSLLNIWKVVGIASACSDVDELKNKIQECMAKRLDSNSSSSWSRRRTELLPFGSVSHDPGSGLACVLAQMNLAEAVL